MNIFKIKTYKEFSALETDRNALLVKVGELETQVNNLTFMSKDMTERQAEHNNVITQLKADHDTALTQLKTDYETQLTNLKVELDTETKSVETKAQKIVATMGLPVAELPKVVTTVTNEDLVTQLQTASPKEREEIFSKNQSEILKLAGITPEKWAGRKV